MKTCVICGVDCGGLPRVKDRSGRYYCRPCYDRTAREVRERKAAAKAARSEEPEGLLLELPPDLDLPVAGAAAAAAGPPACPSCGQPLDAGAVLCTSCGHRLHGEPEMVTHVAAAGPAGEPAPWMWPVELLVMPTRFFRRFGNAVPVLVVVAMFWLFGVANLNDQIETRRAMASSAGSSFVIPNSWGAQWLVVLGGGVLSGLVLAGVGGWWYGLRIRWSGHPDPDVPTVRRVYVLASMVWAVPALLAMGYASLRFGTPAEAANHITVLDWITILAVFWSLFTSYKGVRTVFDVRRGRAVFWFLLLPGSLQVVGLVLLVAAAAIMVIASPPPADLSTPQSFSSATMSFEYPGNWWIDTADPDYDPDAYVGVEPFQDAYLLITLYDSEVTPEEELDVSLEGLRAEFGRLQEGRAVLSWGSFGGAGRTVHATVMGQPMSITVFVAPLGEGRMLEILQSCRPQDVSEVLPGFDLVRRTLVVP